MSDHFFVVTGGPGAGKTSLITRFMFDTFDAKYQVRRGVQAGSRLFFAVVSLGLGWVAVRCENSFENFRRKVI